MYSQPPNHGIYETNVTPNQHYTNQQVNERKLAPNEKLIYSDDDISMVFDRLLKLIWFVGGEEIGIKKVYSLYKTKFGNEWRK